MWYPNDGEVVVGFFVLIGMSGCIVGLCGLAIGWLWKFSHNRLEPRHVAD